MMYARNYTKKKKGNHFEDVFGQCCVCWKIPDEKEWRPWTLSISQNLSTKSEQFSLSPPKGWVRPGPGPDLPERSYERNMFEQERQLQRTFGDQHDVDHNASVKYKLLQSCPIPCDPKCLSTVRLHLYFCPWDSLKQRLEWLPCPLLHLGIFQTQDWNLAPRPYLLHQERQAYHH